MNGAINSSFQPDNIYQTLIDGKDTPKKHMMSTSNKKMWKHSTPASAIKPTLGFKEQLDGGEVEHYKSVESIVESEEFSER